MNEKNEDRLALATAIGIVIISAVSLTVMVYLAITV